MYNNVRKDPRDTHCHLMLNDNGPNQTADTGTKRRRDRGQPSRTEGDKSVGNGDGSATKISTRTSLFTSILSTIKTRVTLKPRATGPQTRKRKNCFVFLVNKRRRNVFSRPPYTRVFNRYTQHDTGMPEDTRHSIDGGGGSTPPFPAPYLSRLYDSKSPTPPLSPAGQ